MSAFLFQAKSENNASIANFAEIKANPSSAETLAVKDYIKQFENRATELPVKGSCTQISPSQIDASSAVDDIEHCDNPVFQEPVFVSATDVSSSAPAPVEHCDSFVTKKPINVIPTVSISQVDAPGLVDDAANSRSLVTEDPVTVSPTDVSISQVDAPGLVDDAANSRSLVTEDPVTVSPTDVSISQVDAPGLVDDTANSRSLVTEDPVTVSPTDVSLSQVDAPGLVDDTANSRSLVTEDPVTVSPTDVSLSQVDVPALVDDTANSRSLVTEDPVTVSPTDVSLSQVDVPALVDDTANSRSLVTEDPVTVSPTDVSLSQVDVPALVDDTKYCNNPVTEEPFTVNPNDVSPSQVDVPALVDDTKYCNNPVTEEPFTVNPNDVSPSQVDVPALVDDTKYCNNPVTEEPVTVNPNDVSPSQVDVPALVDDTKYCNNPVTEEPVTVNLNDVSQSQVDVPALVDDTKYCNNPVTEEPVTVNPNDVSPSQVDVPALVDDTKSCNNLVTKEPIDASSSEYDTCNEGTVSPPQVNSTEDLEDPATEASSESVAVPGKKKRRRRGKRRKASTQAVIPESDGTEDWDNPATNDQIIVRNNPFQSAKTEHLVATSSLIAVGAPPLSRERNIGKILPPPNHLMPHTAIQATEDSENSSSTKPLAVISSHAVGTKPQHIDVTVSFTAANTSSTSVCSEDWDDPSTWPTDTTEQSDENIAAPEKKKRTRRGRRRKAASVTNLPETDGTEDWDNPATAEQDTVTSNPADDPGSTQIDATLSHVVVPTISVHDVTEDWDDPATWPIDTTMLGDNNIAAPEKKKRRRRGRRRKASTVTSIPETNEPEDWDNPATIDEMPANETAISSYISTPSQMLVSTIPTEQQPRNEPTATQEQCSDSSNEIVDVCPRETVEEVANDEQASNGKRRRRRKKKATSVEDSAVVDSTDDTSTEREDVPKPRVAAKPRVHFGEPLVVDVNVLSMPRGSEESIIDECHGSVISSKNEDLKQICNERNEEASLGLQLGDNNDVDGAILEKMKAEAGQTLKKKKRHRGKRRTKKTEEVLCLPEKELENQQGGMVAARSLCSFSPMWSKDSAMAEKALNSYPVSPLWTGDAETDQKEEDEKSKNTAHAEKVERLIKLYQAAQAAIVPMSEMPDSKKQFYVHPLWSEKKEKVKEAMNAYPISSLWADEAEMKTQDNGEDVEDPTNISPPSTTETGIVEKATVEADDPSSPLSAGAIANVEQVTEVVDSSSGSPEGEEASVEPHVSDNATPASKVVRATASVRETKPGTWDESSDESVYEEGTFAAAFAAQLKEVFRKQDQRTAVIIELKEKVRALEAEVSFSLWWFLLIG